MPQMVTVQELALRDVVGQRLYLAAMQLSMRGAVEITYRDDDEVIGVVTDGSRAYGVHVRIYRHRGEFVGDFAEKCNCGRPDGECPHGTALLIASWRGTSDRVSKPSWEKALEVLETDSAPVPGSALATVALQFDLALPDGSSASTRRVAQPELTLRPVTRGRKDSWVRTGASWSNVITPYYGRLEVPEEFRRLLAELLALSGNSTSHYYQPDPQVQLERIGTRRVWDLLLEAQELGLPLVQTGSKSGPVQLHESRLTTSLQLAADGDGLRLAADFGLDDAPPDTPPVTPGAVLALGWPAHGIAWWEPAPAGTKAPGRALHLARLATPLAPDVLRLLSAGPLEVPAGDRDRFLREYYPKLRRRIPVKAGAGLADVPEIHPPVLRLTVTRLPGHRLVLDWEWIYRVGEQVRTVGLDGPDGDRDLAQELKVLSRVSRSPWPARLRAPRGDRPLAHAALAGMEVVGFLADVLPAVQEIDGVEVLIDVQGDDAPEYRETEAAPIITLTGDGDGSRDWFDLAVSVEVEDEVVPFDELFLALAREQEYMLLPSGTYFGLERPEFQQLAALIVEARALDDHREDGVVRLSRFQAGLWGELEQIGVVAGQAAEWQRSVQALSEVTDVVPREVPAGIRAELRPYQVEGFTWLATLYELGLGGVLADDMGLGKTLQTLALIMHVRQTRPESGPFLVVAPTSVASNWAAETAKFAPDLKVAVISGTASRRAAKLSELAADADVVVTTYTLFRLEYDEYAALDWAGLVLDEAQLVKNHQGRGHQCARRLPVPFKLAITGTPMENNLMELWALLSITAPGLFASPTRFTEYYRTPIEKGRDADLLDQLRRRIRPLMLRRTKEQVATDLPAKQEQVLELELNPKHRKAYQTYLQRERQRVLGLLDDFQKNRFEIFRALTMLRQASLDVTLVDPAKHAGVSSTKLDELMELVSEVAREGHRTLVFSQFTRFLDGARRRLDAAGVEYCYLDGKTRDRGDVIQRFKEGSAPVFLISLKAGGFGLNLTEADYVIMLDPWWNPATEAQAVDRTHRIGQTKSVMVYRMVAKDTIEEKVMALKAEKSALFDSVMDGGGFESGVLSADDIRGLLD